MVQPSLELLQDWSARVPLPSLPEASASCSDGRSGSNNDRGHPAVWVIRGTRGWDVRARQGGGGPGNRILPLQDAVDERRGGAQL